MSGKGTLYFEEGKYEGTFSNGNPVGSGVYYYNNGDIVKGTWKNNKFIEKK